MGQSLTHKEASVKREMAKIYKEIVGKGPDTTEIKIYQNFLFMKFVGVFTQMEENLLKMEEGSRIVRDIRDHIILTRKDRYIPKIEKIIESRVEKVTYMLDEKVNTMYVFLLLEDYIGE